MPPSSEGQSWRFFLVPVPLLRSGHTWATLQGADGQVPGQRGPRARGGGGAAVPTQTFPMECPLAWLLAEPAAVAALPRVGPGRSRTWARCQGRSVRVGRGSGPPQLSSLSRGFLI